MARRIREKPIPWYKMTPISSFWDSHAKNYFVPKNLNFWYLFGVFALLVLVNQILTGIWLTMYYTPTGDEAFSSVEYIMRHVEYGWLLRYLHSTGASAFFVVIYLHMYKSIMYGSYQRPRIVIWLSGMALYFLLLAEAFSGYVLPWGQMSYWATKVILAVIGAIPFVGDTLLIWLQGDYTVSEFTLHRFFAFHVIAVPLLLLGFVMFHITALHQAGSNNPDGVEIKKHLNSKGKPIDGITFHPYYTVKDLFGVGVFLIVFLGVVFFAPAGGGYFLEPENFIPADHLSTPQHIAPVWYMAPFYAILRAVPNKLLGIVAMAAAIAILFALPWLDKSPVKSIRYKGLYSKIALSVFVVSFMGLGYLGTVAPEGIKVFLARMFTVTYFAFFLLMPWYTRAEHTHKVPKRVRYP